MLIVLWLAAPVPAGEPPVARLDFYFGPRRRNKLLHALALAVSLGLVCAKIHDGMKNAVHLVHPSKNAGRAAHQDAPENSSPRGLAQEIMDLVRKAGQAATGAPVNSSGHASDMAYLVGFISESCDRCDAIAKAMKKYSADRELPPLYGFVLGEAAELDAYRQRFAPGFTTAHLETVRFFRFIGKAPPRFYLLKNGRILKWWDGEMPEAADVLAATMEP